VRIQPTLFEISRRQPGDLALEDGTRSRTWGELEDRTRAIAHGLTRQVPAGSHVVLVAGNRVEFLEVALACLRAGLVYTPLKSSWTPTEIGSVLTDASTSLVVTDVPAGRQAARDFGLLMLDLDDDFDDWVQRQPVDDPLSYELSGRKMTYTSGTTGRPKGVVSSFITQRPFPDSFAASAGMAETTGLPGYGAHLFVSHLFHGAPLTFGLSVLARGASLRIVPRWDPEIVLEQLATGVTSTSMVPTMFRQLLALPPDVRSAFAAPELVTVLHGGEACPLPVKQAMLEWMGPRLTEYYGFSEGGMTTATSEEWLSHPGTVGRPINQQRVLILDEDGEDVRPGIDGTIYFATPDGVTFSYLNDEAKTAAAHRNGAFTVGDFGHIDADGYLFITGRKSDVIISSGVNIYPAEVESALSDIAGVTDLAIVGAPDGLRGEQVVAVVVTPSQSDLPLVVARIAAAATESLAGYKRPRQFFHAAELPRDPTGKLLRNSLRDMVARWNPNDGQGDLTLIDPLPTSTAVAAIATTIKGT
jgi:long-chain acyl-CoA synthetase